MWKSLENIASSGVLKAFVNFKPFIRARRLKLAWRLHSLNQPWSKPPILKIEVFWFNFNNFLWISAAKKIDSFWNTFCKFEVLCSRRFSEKKSLFAQDFCRTLTYCILKLDCCHRIQKFLTGFLAKKVRDSSCFHLFWNWYFHQLQRFIWKTGQRAAQNPYWTNTKTPGFCWLTCGWELEHFATFFGDRASKSGCFWIFEYSVELRFGKASTSENNIGP